MNGDQAILEIHRDVKSLRSDVTEVMMNGCSKREADLNRIAAVEGSLIEVKDTLKWILRTSLVTAFGIVAFLIKAFLPYLIH